MAKESRRGNGEGNIEKLPNGKYRARIRVGDRRLSFTGTRREVQQKVQEARRAHEAGRLPIASGITVHDFLDLWLKAREGHVAPTTMESYELNVQRLTRHIGTVRLDVLRSSHITACYHALASGDRPLKPASVQQAHRTLRMALRYAVKHGYLNYNPLDLVEPPKVQRKEMQVLTRVQVEALFTATREHRLHALWVLLVTTGLRVGEATALRWEDADLDAAGLQVRQTLHWQRNKGMVLGPTKTDHSRRTVDLPARTIVALRRHLIQQYEERLAVGPAWHDEDLIFCTETGGPLSAGYLGQALHRALEDAGLPRVRVHDLRHTFATLTLQQGVSVKAVQNALGHSTALLTLDTYAHVTRDMRREAADAIGKLFPATG